MRVNLLHLENERKFEEFCQALLSEEFSRFQAYSPPDRGMDGYDSDTQTIFQAYFPERAPRKDKIINDLRKANKNAWTCKRWVLMIPKNPTAPFKWWLCEEQQAAYSFRVEVWGKTEIEKLLRKHAGVLKAYFGREEKREKPKRGDVESGLEISSEQALELRDMITEIAQQEAFRKKRKVRGTDFSREFGEFNAHFELSSYDRLSAGKFLKARRYLEKKLYARRKGESRIQERRRLVGGIHGIQGKENINRLEYETILNRLTGKSSTNDMDIPDLRKVFGYFKKLQESNES